MGARSPLLWVLIAVVLLGVGEVVLRILSPGWMFCFRTRACPQPGGAWYVTQQGRNFSVETGEPLLAFHPQLFWWPRPDVYGTFWETAGVRTNSLGLRQGPVDPSARRNVLVVGDSVVWGAKVQEGERFSDRAASLLRRRPGFADVQVVNAGVPGFSSFQVLQFLREVGIRRFRPRVVVICAGINDVWLTDLSDRAHYEANTKLGPRIRRALAKSNLFLFLNRYVVEAVVWLGTGRNLKGFSVFYGDRPGPPQVLRNSPPEAVENVQEAVSLIRKSGGKVVLILQETGQQRPPFWSWYHFQAERDRFAELVLRKRWTSVDMATLRRPPLGLPVDRCFLDFCHPTPEAHAVLGYLVAEAVAGLLET